MRTRLSNDMLCTFALLTVCLSGCQTLDPDKSKPEAGKRWNEMRGQIKLQLARQHYASGLFEDTVRAAGETISLAPQLPEAYAVLARANLELGRIASAEHALETAVAAGLETAEIQYLLGVIHEQRHDTEAAHERFARARALDAFNVDYLIAEVESLVTLDRPNEARERLREHAGTLDDHAAVAALSAHLSQLVGDDAAATRSFREALPARAKNEQSGFGHIRGHPVLAEELGRLLVNAGRYDEALTNLRPLLSQAGAEENRGSLRRAVARCHLAAGDPHEAKNVLTVYVAQNPDDVPTQLLLAKAAVAAGDLITALRALDQLQLRAPNDPEVWLVRAAVNYQRGRYSAAAADLYDVLQNNPDDVDAHCLLAEVLRAQQRVDAARSHFQRALELDDTSAWAAEGLKSLDKRDAPDSSEKTETRLTAVEADPPSTSKHE